MQHKLHATFKAKEKYILPRSLQEKSLLTFATNMQKSIWKDICLMASVQENM